MILSKRIANGIAKLQELSCGSKDKTYQLYIEKDTNNVVCKKWLKLENKSISELELLFNKLNKKTEFEEIWDQIIDDGKAIA